MQSLLLTQGEKSAATVGCTTVRGQANPQWHPRSGFHEEKLITGDLASKRHMTCNTASKMPLANVQG